MSKKDILSRLCPECMAPAMKNGVCVKCGYDAETEPEHINNKILRPRTILNEQYAIGKAISHTDSFTAYYAYDLFEEKRVIVESVIDIYNRTPYYTAALKSEDKMLKEVHERMDAVRALNNSALITYTDCIECEGCFYFVSDFYEGTTLQELMKEQGSFRTSETLTLLRALQEPLEAMHNAGIVNGCVTPDRIIIQKDGSVRLKDSDHFRILFAEEKEKLANNSYIPYDFYSNDACLAPESDVYSLAAIAYAMLTGHTLPLACDREYDDEIENPNEFGANLTDEGVCVLKNALSVYPEDRIQSISEFLDTFEEANETVLEIENDLNHGFDFEKAEKQKNMQKRADDAAASKKKHTGNPKKAYRGIPSALKITLVSIVGVLLILELLMFVGVLDPISALARIGVNTPDLNGLTLEQAKSKLSQSGLNILVVDACKCNNSANTVYKQTPYANKKVLRGDVVCITASTGNEDYSEGIVPNVRYMKLDSAFNIISKKCGYNVVISLVSSNDVMAGCVVDQSQHAGVQLPVGSTVELTVSSGSMLQSERVKISDNIDAQSAAVVFMDDNTVYAVRVAQEGTTLGNLMPEHPSEALHNGLDFIGWSRAPEGTGGEFTAESTYSGVITVYAFFADRGATIATPSPSPSIVIEQVTPEPNVQSPVITDYIISDEPILLPTQAPSAIVFTPAPSAKPTVQPTEPPANSETPTHSPTHKPTPENTPKPTETPEPTESFYLDGIFFKESEITISVGETKKLQVIFDGNPKSKELTYRSSNKSVVTINSDGVIEGIGTGTTYVYAVSKVHGILEASCKITVEG